MKAFDAVLKSFGLEMEQMNSNLKILNKGIRRHLAINRRIKLPGDLYQVTDEGAWIRAHDCPLPTYIEGAAKGTHKQINGKVYKLLLWDELEDRFYPIKAWWKKSWMKHLIGNCAGK
jgi:hypothetical protein